MSESLAGLVRTLHAAGSLHPLAIGIPAALGVVGALYAWADDTAAPLSRRLAGVAVVLLGLALLMRLGTALDGPQPVLRWWQAALGVLVLPLFLRGTRLGGVAAMLLFLCIAVLLAQGAALVVDVPTATAAAFALGVAAGVAAAIARRFAPPPPPVAPVALQARLDDDEAREGADKYTRE